jgi:hypothetical protein
MEKGNQLGSGHFLNNSKRESKGFLQRQSTGRDSGQEKSFADLRDK